MPIKSLRLLFTAICLLLSISKISAQYGDDVVRVYPPSEYKAGPFIYNFAKDDRGYLYIATNNGVLEFDGSAWNLIPTSNYSDAGILTRDEDGTIYVGATNEFGFLKADSIGQMRYESLVPLVEEDISLIDDVWQVVLFDDKVYFQSYEGIFIYNKKDQVDFIPIKDIYLFDVFGTLYASKFPSGQFGEFKNGEMEPITGAEDILKNDLIYSIFDYSKDSLLIVTGSSGLYIFEKNNRTITPLESQASDFLSTHSFFDGVRINEDYFCFGTWEKGIIFSDLEGNILKNFNVDDGLLGNKIFHIIKGNSNDLWIGSNNGMAHLVLDSLGISTTPNSYLKPFANINNIYGDGQLIKGAHLDLQEINFDKNYPTTLSFNFSTPSWSGKNIDYSYKLEGFDDSWSEWSPEPRKEYTNLAGGNYVFNVRSKSRLDNVISETSSIQINIPIPWYSATWVYIVGIVSVFGFVYAFIQFRTYRLKQANLKLARLIDSHTKDLQEQRDKLQSLNKDLSITNKELDSFVYHTSHDLKAPLKSILGLVGLAKKESVNDNLQLYFNMIEGSVVKLEEFITSIIDYSANAKAKLSVEPVDFESLMEEVESTLRYLDDSDKIHLSHTVDIKTNFYSDSKRLKIILNNLVSNAIKYHDLEKDSPFIKVDVAQVNGKVDINVTDNGIGISQTHQDKIFDMFYRASEKSFGSGLGLYIVKETVNKLNGEIGLSSKEGKGTTFHLQVPNLTEK